jgi:hypothetical protein
VWKCGGWGVGGGGGGQRGGVGGGGGGGGGGPKSIMGVRNLDACILAEPSQRPATKNVCKTRGCTYSF